MCSRRAKQWALAVVILTGALIPVVRLSQAAELAAPIASAEIRVGIQEGDIRGEDHRALQAAVDDVAGLGGGTGVGEIH